MTGALNHFSRIYADLKSLLRVNLRGVSELAVDSDKKNPNFRKCIISGQLFFGENDATHDSQQDSFMKKSNYLYFPILVFHD